MRSTHYLTSRDVVDLLAKNNELRAILTRPGADFLFRYPTFWLPDDNEFLYQRFQWMASAYVDPVTSISTIEVNAFAPEDAQTLDPRDDRLRRGAGESDERARLSGLARHGQLLRG